MVASINDLTDRLRQQDQRIIWIRQEFSADLSDAFLDMRRDNIRITIAGTPGCRTLPELIRAPSDLEMVKKRDSAFFGTALDSVLRELQPTSLIVAGVNTHACVRMAVVDAFQRDDDVIVAAKCVGSYDRVHHDVTLQYLPVAWRDCSPIVRSRNSVRAVPSNQALPQSLDDCHVSAARCWL